ncbi:MAG: hypothetical protein H0T76_24035 [Nannocystis sp.]|nr:hypothetical protein [Nannocystis sp.]MBA3549558.1 hypothetical protein [Nannocystis sp.]
MLRNCFGALVLLAACAPDEGELEVRIYGEAFIEEGIPASEFADGWDLKFERFLISVGSVSVGPAGEAPGLDELGYQVYDLSRPSMGLGQLVTGAAVPVGRQYATFVVRPDADAVASGVSEADLARLQDGGLALYVAGSATKAGVTKTFAWGFATNTSYSDCKSEAEVGADAPATVQLTIHGDHLFYDDLFSETPDVRFDLVAQADGDGDGEVTQAELLAVDLRPLTNYQVGSTGIVDLWHFIEHQTGTLGHIDGEGHCQSTTEE